MTPHLDIIEQFTMTITRNDASLLALAIRRFLNADAEAPGGLSTPDRDTLAAMTNQLAALADGGTR
jgi:hypothetical protein